MLTLQILKIMDNIWQEEGLDLRYCRNYLRQIAAKELFGHEIVMQKKESFTRLIGHVDKSLFDDI